jgi:hypothetical protein
MATGSVYYRDEDGLLWLAVSYEDEDGVVTTQATAIPEEDNG